MTTVRAAVVQAAPVQFDSAATVPLVNGLVADARAAGAQLVVFPEAFLGGYPKGVDFGTRVGMRLPGGREFFARYFAGAMEVPGPVCAELGAIAAAHGVHLVIGVIERAGSTLYCALLTFGPDGTLLGHRRKLVPTAAERLMWGSGDGSTLEVVATSVGRLAAVVCWEIRGGSCIVGPLGEVLAGPVFDAPAILTADLDLDLIPGARYDLDVVGHYARPDIFTLSVDTTARPGVARSSRPEEPAS